MKREEAIKDLDIIRFNPHWDELVNEEYRKELMEMAITALQNQPVWIPVSERLPEESLNSVIGWDTYRNRCCFVQYLGGRFVLGDDNDSVNVTAWMPLPEPYLESEKRMANRNTLHSNKLDAFRKWLIKTGWTIEEPKGIWEVLRAKKAGRKNPLIVYQKMNKEHLSVLDRDIDVIKRFLQEK